MPSMSGTHDTAGETCVEDFQPCSALKSQLCRLLMRRLLMHMRGRSCFFCEACSE